MTPLVGILIAVLAAWLAPNTRTVVISVLVPMTAATAVQSWDLGADWGSNPPSTIRDPSYWVVQLIIISVIVAVGVGIFRLRARRAAGRGQSLRRPALAGRRGTAALLASTFAMSVVLLAGEYVVYKVRPSHGHGAGDMPWTGVLGLAIGILALVAIGARLAVSARTIHRTEVSA